jgi:hypothetical protein
VLFIPFLITLLQDTRHLILVNRPSQRASWLGCVDHVCVPVPVLKEHLVLSAVFAQLPADCPRGLPSRSYAVAEHLQGNHELAVTIITSYEQTLEMVRCAAVWRCQVCCGDPMFVGTCLCWVFVWWSLQPFLVWGSRLGTRRTCWTLESCLSTRPRCSWRWASLR